MEHFFLLFSVPATCSKAAISNDAPKDPAKTAPKSPPKSAPNDPPESAPNHPPKSAPKDPPQSAPKDGPKSAAKSVPTLRVGFHEEHGRFWDGRRWNTSWEKASDPMSAAVAIFSDGSRLICPNLLAADLEGKGILRIERPEADTGKKHVIKPPIWEGVSEGFGRMMVVNKIDSCKDKFASLMTKGGQLTQCSAKSCKYNLPLGEKILKLTGMRIIEKNINNKADVVKARDEIREELKDELEVGTPRLYPTPLPGQGDPGGPGGTMKGVPRAPWAPLAPWVSLCLQWCGV